MNMLKKLTDLAKSEKGKELAEKATAKARQIANDPETREKLDAAKKKITDRVGGGGDKSVPAPGPDEPVGFGKDEGPVATSTTGGAIDPENAPDPIEPDHDPTPRPSGEKAA